MTHHASIAGRAAKVADIAVMELSDEGKIALWRDAYKQIRREGKQAKAIRFGGFEIRDAQEK